MALMPFCTGDLWDSNLTWYTDQPDFTPCFHKTVLVYIPCLFLCLITPGELYLNYTSKLKGIPWSWINITKLISGKLLCILSLIELIVNCTIEENGSEANKAEIADYLGPCVKFVTYLTSILLLLASKNSGRVTSGPQFFFWISLSVCQSFTTSSIIIHKQIGFNESTVEGLVCVLSFLLILLNLVLQFFADTSPAYTGIDEQPANRSSEFESSFVSRLLFFWFDSTIWKNRNKTLTLSDLWDLHPQDSVWTLGPMWERLWNRALEKNKKKLNKSGIIPVLIQGFNSTFIKGAFLQLVFVLSQFLNPLLLNLIINFIQEDGPIWKGIFYTIMLSVTALIIAVSDSHYWFNVYRSGLQIKTCLSAAMFKKSLKLSSASRRERTAGEIVNLISVDSPKLSIAYAFVNNVWAAPLQAGLSIFFLYKTIGVSIFAGLGILCVLFPVNSIAWYVMEKNQSAQMTKKDKRVRLISEILNGIKVIKLFSWEFSFIKRINKLREEEVDKLRVIQILEGTQYFVWCSAPILMALASFLTFALIDPVNNILDTHTAFVTLTLFNTLRAPLFMLPFGIASLIQGAVSVKRINSFLNLEELDPDSVSHSEDCTDSVVLDDATFKWNANISEQTILNNVTLRVPKGKLIAIVGRVGSGKSSLLSALLGEMVRVGGNANVNGKIAYVPQQAWMRNATLKNNILFRKNFYKEKYDKVIEACALKPDLEILTGGDETEIGEKGINLSGGQKQRISLARAVYNNADIYLLDDPLSAVDSHVGKHLFEKVIGPKGALSKKTRILVTHGISFLPMVDQIAVMKDGQISELGTYDELLSSRGAFAEFLMEQVEEQDVLSTLSESERADMWQRLEETLGPENLHSPRKLNQNEQMFFGRSKTTSVCSNYESAAQSEYGNVASIFEPSRWLRQHSQDYGLTPRSPQPSATQGQTQVKTEDNSGLKNSGEFQVGRDLIEDEFAESNGVKFEIYLYYAKAIGLSITTIGVLLYALCQVFNIGGSIWLSIWAGDEAAKHSIAIRNKYLMVYAAMSLSQSVAILMAVIVISFCTLRASVKLHKDLLEHLLMSTMAFFDTTPLGRIINRFSKDIDEVDLMIPSYIKELLTDVFSVIGTLLLVCYASPIVIILVVPLIIMFYFIQKWYLTVSRQLKRMINVTSSPINSSLTESFQGVSSIRAYKLEESFIKENYEYIEQNQKCAFPEVASRQWLFNRLEILANLLVVFTSLMAVIYRDSIDPGLVGFSLTYIFSFQLDLYLMTKYSSELEKSIVSVERIREYQQTPTEAAFEIHDTNPGPHWPEHGSIEFDNYGTRYRDGLDLVLKGISFKVASGEKVGIVGRTGAGKSSLTLALFRMVEGVQGCIKIDGIDISKLGLSTLRSAITIIPQDPVLFTGTLRFNLDPFHRYSDQALWQTLEHAHLKTFAMQLSNGLDHEVSEGGENLSVGQRQLVCLARALLKKTKVLILDEATAAVDLETDDLIQATIRDEFKDCTVLTIAHRLKTILDNDKILVLDSGKVKEFDEPEKLLKNKKTIFYSLAKDAGIILT